jgi:pSer/pThr/pTyr-binding forkhead associated (FHA) protein
MRGAGRLPGQATSYRQGSAGAGPDFLNEIANEPSLGSATLHNSTNQETSPLLTRRVVLGRELDCDISVNDANASRQHARLEQNAVGAWKLIDLGSTNGTQLNGRAVTQAVLRDGDQITIGTTTLEFWE